MSNVDMLDDISRVEGGDAGAVEIGLIGEAQMGQLFSIFADIVARGEGFPQQPPLTRPVFDDVWVRPVTLVAGATRQGATGRRLLPQTKPAGHRLAHC